MYRFDLCVCGHFRFRHMGGGLCCGGPSCGCKQFQTERLLKPSAIGFAVHEPVYMRRPPNAFEGFRTCSDCDWSWVWWRSSYSYCKECNCKNGYYSMERVEVDADKLLEFCGMDPEVFATVLEGLQ